jgi:large subunit ribosomal protein L23
MSVLVKPLITEKLTRITERVTQGPAGKRGGRQFGFIVALDATKEQVKAAVEQHYTVSVVSVRTTIQPARVRSRMTKKGFVVGKSSRYKKAYVTLAAGQEIDFYKNV